MQVSSSAAFLGQKILALTCLLEIASTDFKFQKLASKTLLPSKTLNVPAKFPRRY